MSGAARRIAVYLRRMFPPAVMVPAGVAHFAAVYWALQALAGAAPPLRLTWRAAAGAATVVLFMLIMRTYDELKDAATDLVLGRAGDPRYKDRPIVTGEVRIEDLRALRWIVSAALVALNAPLGWPWPFAAFAGVFALKWLSFKWFFYPKMSENLLLAFATHNPISLAVSGYVVAVSVRDFGTAGIGGWAAALLVGLWLPVAAWETSRKVRRPEDETAYRTYSKVLGWKTAALVPAGFVAGSAALLVPAARAMGLATVYPGVVSIAAAMAIGSCLLLRLAPTAGRANLRPVMELYVTVANFGLAIGLALKYGVQL